MLQDELSAIQLEITTIEEKNRNLIKENQQLVQRWMEKMNQEADKMNEATAFYESALRMQAQSPKKPRPTSIASTSSIGKDHATSSQQQRKRITSIILPHRPFRTLVS